MRITTRTEAGRRAIEVAGAECFIGTPDRIASLRYALDGATLACWLLGTAAGEASAVASLHGSRLESMLGQIIDTTVRGFLYEAAGPAAPGGGARLVAARTARNAVPHRCLDADPADGPAWLAQAQAAVADLLSGQPGTA